MSSENRVNHFLYVDIMRGLAAMYVVLHHATQTVTVQSRSVWQAIHAIFGGGGFAVDVFIVLSGFSLGVSYWSGKYDGYRNYLARRAMRILPPYFITCAISLLLIYTVIDDLPGTKWQNSRTVTPASVVWHAVLLHDWFPAYWWQINYVLWSVAVEWKIYFLLPLIGIFIARAGQLPALLAIGATTYTAWFAIYHFNVLNPGPHGVDPYYIWLFALGMASVRAIFNHTDQIELNEVRSAWVKMAIVTFISVSAVVAIRKFFPLNAAAQVQSAFVGMWAAMLLYCLGITEKIGINYGRAARSMAKLGAFGYSLYLIHPILVQLIWQWVFIPLGWTGESSILGMVVLSALLIPPITYVFYLLCERPFHNMSRRIGRPKSYAAAILVSDGNRLPRFGQGDRA